MSREKHVKGLTSSWTGQRQRRVRLHALVQRGHGQKLPLVNAELGDVFVRSHVLRRPLLHGGPRVEVEHLQREKDELQIVFLRGEPQAPKRSWQQLAANSKKKSRSSSFLHLFLI